MLIAVAGLWITLLGMQAAVCTTLGGSIQYQDMILFYGVASLITIALACLSGRWSCLGFGLVFTGAGIFLWRKWDLFVRDARVLIRYINKRSMAYTGQALFPEHWCRYGKLDHNAVIITGCIILGIYISLAALKLRSKFMAVIPLVLLYCMALLLGKTPGQLPALLLIVGMALFVMWISQRQKVRGVVRWKVRRSGVGRQKRYLLELLVLIVGISVSWYLTARLADTVFQDVGRIQNKQHQMERDLLTKIEESGQYLRGMLGIDGGGALSNTAPHYQDKVVFEVTVEKMPQTPMYLRGFTGEVYHKGKWTASKQTNSVSEREKKKIWKGKYCDSRYLEFLSEDQDVSIRYTAFGRRSKYLYIPYSESGQTDPMSKEEKPYYQGGGDDELELYQQLADSISDMSFGVGEFLIMDVQGILWSNTQYSLKLEPLPSNRDYAENFLFYSQRGYCEHFATAGTLLLRNMNHFARYTTGYRVSPDCFQKNKDGTYTAKVLDSYAHAWCDVWAYDQYWMPQEMTPSDDTNMGSYGLSQPQTSGERMPSEEGEETEEPQNTPSNRSTEPSATPLDTAQPQASASPASEAAKGGDSGRTKDGILKSLESETWWQQFPLWLRVCLVSGGIAAGICAAAVAHHSYKRRKRIQLLEQMRSKNSGYYVRLRLDEFIHRLYRFGVAVQSNMPERQWIQRLTDTLSGQIEPEEADRLLELARRAAFSQEPVMSEEIDWLEAYCGKIERLADAAYRQKGRIKSRIDCIKSIMEYQKTGAANKKARKK